MKHVGYMIMKASGDSNPNKAYQGYDKDICHISVTRSMMAFVGGNMDVSMEHFAAEKRSHHAGRSKGQCSLAGFNPDLFSSNSLRREVTTYRLLAGSSNQEIKTRGDCLPALFYRQMLFTFVLKVLLQERITDDLRVANLLVVVDTPTGHT